MAIFYNFAVHWLFVEMHFVITEKYNVRIKSLVRSYQRLALKKDVLAAIMV